MINPVRPEAAPVIPDRYNFAFSENGRHSVCLLRRGDDDVTLESWTLTAEPAVGRSIPAVEVTEATNTLPLDDGRILLFRSDATDPTHPHDLVLLQPQGDGFAEHRLGEISALLGGYLLSSPSAAQVAFAVTRDDAEHSTIWRLSASPPWIERVVQVPGCLSGGVWLDGDAGVLAANLISESHRCSGIVVDLAEGSWRRIWSVSDRSTDRIVLYSPRSTLLVVSSNAAGEERLGWGWLGERTVHFPDALHRPGYVRRALALDSAGERLLVEERHGAVSRLFTYTPADQGLQQLDGPQGTASSPASWVGDLIRFRFSTPDHPPTLATVRLAAKPRWSLSRTGEPVDQAAWAPAELVELQGPAGPIEAVVYGGPRWRQCRHLVVALHGGPLSLWRFEFDPLFQCLAAAGVAVVAPNYRGSTGYGDDHLRAALAHWGGPDLDDVLHLGRDLGQDRARRGLPKPVVLGASYGAFLALLAACHQPATWSACVALAPFLSGPRLHENARGAAVRDRVAALGGLVHGDDAAGPRDVLAVCSSLSAPLLLIHGTRDLTIPVEESRTLARRLSGSGRTQGADFEYLEVDSDHTGVALAQRNALRQRVVRFCRTRLRPGRDVDDSRTSFTHNERT
ncbi:MAG: alpha/beta fold hydrolase [Actinomycetota bacterium]|nr:alpha/beta fold hydrolase [Actinomycetota bacterium]